MGFVMEGLDAETYDRKYDDKALVRRIGRYFRPKLPMMIFVASMILLNAIMDTVLPIVLARSIDSLSLDFTTQAAVTLSAAILVSGGMSWLFNYFRQSYTARAVSDVVLNLREDVFDFRAGHVVLR